MEEKRVNGNILIVDDEENILKSLKRIFEAHGYQCFIANGGEAGLTILAQQPIDIIISDMRMPNMDGVTFLKKTIQQHADCKRLLLTGYADIQSAIGAINDGKIDYYISKPWDNDNITQIVNNLIENKKLRETNIDLHKKIVVQNQELKVLNNNLEEKVSERTEELRSACEQIDNHQKAVIGLLSKIVELREINAKGLCKRIAQHAKLLAEKLSLAETEIENIYLAATLYNIGKLGIPDDIAHKPYQRMEAEQLKEYLEYPILGATILSPFEQLKEVADAILHHREHYNGNGIPHKLSGQAIPMSSRVIRLAIDYNELQNGLVFNEPYHPRHALEYITDNAGHFYDPKLVKIFIDIVKQLPDENRILTERMLTPNQLTPGMVLARDVRSKYGLVLLAQGQRLTSTIIEKLTVLGNIKIYVDI